MWYLEKWYQNQFAGQWNRAAAREQTCGHRWGRRGWDELRAALPQKHDHANR